MRIYKSKYEGFVTTFNSKAYGIKYYMPVQFKKGNEPIFSEKDYVDISFTNWFGSCYKKKNGETAPKIVVMEYAQINNSNNDSHSEIENCDYSPFEEEYKEFY